MARGDVVFYVAQPQTIITDLIEWRTNGPFVHVGIDLGDGTMVDAMPQGVTHHAYVDTPYRFSPPVSQKDIERGIAFLLGRVKRHMEYGWVDCIDAALPRWWKLVLFDRDAYDCSHLVTQYLMQTGGVSMPEWATARPQSVSPNDVARFCRMF